MHRSACFIRKIFQDVMMRSVNDMLELEQHYWA
jgi:hypothetical protein